MKRLLICLAASLFWIFSGVHSSLGDSVSPPASPVKLIFIHHSTGGNWLADANESQPYGGLGAALAANNYYVSATNYGWGPEGIGDRTDIPNWPEWFTGAGSSAVLSALYQETGQNFGDFGSWARLPTDPGGENRIIVFKSCFPNSDLFGDPDDAPAASPDEQFTVSNAKAVYDNLLTYFQTRQDKLFIVVTAPPQTVEAYGDDVQTPAERAANARAFNDWLVNDWLAGYAYNNVGVFDYYNVLTAADNHHRWDGAAVEHVVNTDYSFAAYATDAWDSHPNTAGHQKATTEFVPLLNYYYNRWIGGPAASHSIYFPHTASSGSWETEIAIINPSASATLTGTLRAYSHAGQQIESAAVSLGPLGRQAWVVGETFTQAANIGYFILTSDRSDATGYLKFYEAGRYRVAMPAVDAVNTGDLYLAHIASSAQWWTGISVVNTTAAAKTLTFVFNTGDTRSVTLAAGEHRAFMIKSLFGGTTPANVSCAVIQGGAGVVGLSLFGSMPDSGQNYLGGQMLKNATATRLTYPHVAQDATWWTGVALFNPSGATANVTLQPYTSAGAALTPLTFQIAANTNTVAMASTLGLPSGTAWFDLQSDRALTGFELFGTYDGNQLAGFNTVALGGRQGIFPKLEQSGWTGLALVNTEAASATVTLTAYTDGGATVAARTLTLAAHGKLVGMAPTLLSHNLAGAAYIVYSADRELAGFVLNGSSDQTMLDGLPALLVASAAPSSSLVQASDFQYLGAFRLPGGDTPPQTFAYGGNAMTFNPDGDAANGDAYPGSLFIMGHDRIAFGGLPDGNQVAEISIPAPAVAASPDDLPQAAFLQNFHDVTAGFFTDMEEIPKVGMQYLNHALTGPLIHLAWGQHLQPQDEPSHAWFGAQLDSAGLQGFWFIGNQNLYSVNGYLFDIPGSWADANTGGRCLATGRMRDGGQGGMGPALFAYRPFQADGSAPADGARLAESVLLLYENADSTEQIERCMNGYQHADEWEGGAWITTPGGKSAVLFAGTKATGAKYWYGYINPAGAQVPCVDAHVTDFTTCRLSDGSPCPSEDFAGCCDEAAQPCASNRGWWSSRFDARLILFDPADLAQVAAGTMDPWEPQPYASLDIDDRLYLNPTGTDLDMLGSGDQRRYRIGDAAYDRNNALLYVLEQFADGAKPVVHVWKIN